MAKRAGTVWRHGRCGMLNGFGFLWLTEKKNSDGGRVCKQTQNGTYGGRSQPGFCTSQKFFWKIATALFLRPTLQKESRFPAASTRWSRIRPQLSRYASQLSASPIVHKPRAKALPLEKLSCGDVVSARRNIISGRRPRTLIVCSAYLLYDSPVRPPW